MDIKCSRFLALFGCVLFSTLVGHVFGQDNSADEAIENTQQLTSPLLTPEEAVSKLRMPEGFSATVFASEPDIIQPIAVTTDARGRVWVAECLTYAESKRNFDLRYKDRILIFEDTNQDGVFDKRKVFWSGAKRLTSIEVGFGGVWVTAAPNFLFIPDRDQDDVPDSEPEILLDGWNADFVRHNMVNGLKWGPDGWLYGRHGIQATSHVGPPGSTDSQRTPLNCCMWRFHPKTREFEVVCEGTTNPWGHDWDKNGELFMINTVIGHLWHVMPGARFRRMYGSHFNPYTYEVIEQTADHFHFSGKENWNDVNKIGISGETDLLGGGHAHCGMMIYQGDAWPERYRDKLFTANFHGRRLNMESLHREGNGYVGRHEDDFIFSDDLWFRGVELVCLPGGNVLLLDWSDIGECHENDGVHRTSGRIYKITFGEPRKVDSDLQAKTTEELFGYLDHENQWFARTARRVLQERFYAGETGESFDGEVKKRLESIYSRTADVNSTLQTMWLRHAVSYPELPYEQNESLSNWLRHDDEHVRANVVKLLVDRPSDELTKDMMFWLTRMAREDESGLVRLHLASAMRRMSHLQRMEMASILASYQSDAADRTLPKLLWYLLESALVEHCSIGFKIAASTQIPHIRRCIVRRMTAEIDKHPEFADALLMIAMEPKLTKEVLSAMREALSGRHKVAEPETWQEVAAELNQRDSEEVKESVAFLGAVFGEGVSIDALKKIAFNWSGDPAVRRDALKAYSETRPEGLFADLRGLIGDRSVAIEVVRSMAYCKEDQVAKVIMNQLPRFDVETRRAAITTLCSRPHWSKQLLTSIKTGKVEREELTAAHARQIQSHGVEDLDALVTEVWGFVFATPEGKIKEIERLRELVTREDIAPDLTNGGVVFEKSCKSCHVLFGSGGKRGPDLTGADRKNLEYLLENIVAPSASVADTYRSSILQMEDGRTLIGVITEETEKTLKLLMVEQEVVIEVDQIEARRNTKESLMPEGLLNNLSPQEVVDLFGYLGK